MYAACWRGGESRRGPEDRKPLDDTKSHEIGEQGENAMEQLKQLLTGLSSKLESLARANAVVAKPISVADRHVVPLCELGLAFGGAGGTGEGDEQGSGEGGKGTGAAAGGAAKAVPVAVLVVENGQVHIEIVEK
jgi:uncharacterized spore protein YtfJ